MVLPSEMVDWISRVASLPTHGDSSSNGVHEVVGDDQPHSGAEFFIGASRVQGEDGF